MYLIATGMMMHVPLAAHPELPVMALQTLVGASTHDQHVAAGVLLHVLLVVTAGGKQLHVLHVVASVLLHVLLVGVAD